jgi:hypothetical protein
VRSPSIRWPARLAGLTRTAAAVVGRLPSVGGSLASVGGSLASVGGSLASVGQRPGRAPGVARLLLPRLSARAAVPAGLAVALTVGLVAGGASAAAHRPAGARGLTTSARFAAWGGGTTPSRSHRTTPASRPRPADAVAPLRRLYVPDLLVTASRPLPASLVRAIERVSGVRASVVIGLGRVAIAGTRATAAVVDPSTFRGWTPLLTARSDPLWRNIAAGQSAVSFDMAQGLSLPLGGTLPFTARTTRPVRIGAFASVGVAGVDAVLADPAGQALGLPTGNALLISAPGADPLAERSAVSALLPPGYSVQLLQSVVVLRDAGEYLTRAQIATVIRAAASRIGLPYVWGGNGPGQFDCSGLVGWAFAQAGIPLPRTAAQQFLAGPHVPYAQARPGDLLFWTYDPTAPGFVDHVALYVGNGMMIVAAHTGTVVSYVPVPLADLAGVVRVDPGMAAQVGGPRYP